MKAIYGIPILFDPDAGGLAYARGLFIWKYIAVGPLFFGLTPREQSAVILHEAKHCLDFHLEKRLLMLPFYWTDWALRVTHQQELDADAFAAQKGFGVELLHVIRRRYTANSEFHPPFNERMKHLVRLIRENIHAAA